MIQYLSAIEIMEENMKQRLLTAEKRLKEIDEELMSDNVTRDIKRFRDISKERSYLSEQVEAFHRYQKVVSDLEDALLMSNDSDPEIAEMAKEEIKTLQEQEASLLEEIKGLLVPRDPNDDKNIVVEIRGAAGGDEANIFAGDLFRMYTRYAEAKGWKIQMLDENPSEAGGFALVSFMIKGDSVYSRLKFESGAHRVQRVPRTYPYINCNCARYARSRRNRYSNQSTGLTSRYLSQPRRGWTKR